MTGSGKRDIAEIFGYAPDDLSTDARSLWNLGACPFINGKCSKINHDQTIIYGTCSVINNDDEVIICPNTVYQRFEKIIGDIPSVSIPKSDTITVHTYALGEKVSSGKQRELIRVRNIMFSLDDFSSRFISGPNLPSGEDLDNAVRKVLGV